MSNWFQELIWEQDKFNAFNVFCSGFSNLFQNMISIFSLFIHYSVYLLKYRDFTILNNNIVLWKWFRKTYYLTINNIKCLLFNKHLLIYIQSYLFVFYWLDAYIMICLGISEMGHSASVRHSKFGQWKIIHFWNKDLVIKKICQ